MKNMKVKKALMAMGAVMALGMAVQGHAQTTPPPAPAPLVTDASELDAAKGADYAAANADLGAQCGASSDKNFVSDASGTGDASMCPSEDGRSYNADASGGAPV